MYHNKSFLSISSYKKVGVSLLILKKQEKVTKRDNLLKGVGPKVKQGVFILI